MDHARNLSHQLRSCLFSVGIPSLRPIPMAPPARPRVQRLEEGTLSRTAAAWSTETPRESINEARIETDHRDGVYINAGDKTVHSHFLFSSLGCSHGMIMEFFFYERFLYTSAWSRSLLIILNKQKTFAIRIKSDLYYTTFRGECQHVAIPIILTSCPSFMLSFPT